MTLDENYNLIVVKPKSRKDVVRLALKIRELLKIGIHILYIDVLGILEFMLPSLFDDDITFSVPDEWYREEEAYYDAQKNVIYIRADVYGKAMLGDGRARFTILHEIAHYILFKLWGIPHTMPLEKIDDFSDATLKAMDPEWQANTFAGAFLCKPDIVRNMEIGDIEKQCGVSRKAAQIAYCHSRGIPYRESDFGDFVRWSYRFAMSGNVSLLWD